MAKLTPDDFRRIALDTEGATESSHMGHPDFRLNGRIFATLCYPDKDWGMVRLTPGEQQLFVIARPRMFAPAAGAWGAGGATIVRLAEAHEPTLREAMALAWTHAAAARRSKRPPAAPRRPRPRSPRPK